MKLLSLTSYLTFIWGLLFSICLTPVESLRPNNDAIFSGRRPGRTHCLSSAQRSALASQVATAALAPSAASLAVRMVAGPIGWAALGSVQAWCSPRCTIHSRIWPPSNRRRLPDRQLDLFVQWADLHHSESQHRGKSAPAPVCPGGLMFGYLGGPTPGMTSAGPSNWWCPPSPAQQATGTPSASDIQQYLLAQSPSSPDAIEQHTSPVGTTGTTQPADNTTSQPVSRPDADDGKTEARTSRGYRGGRQCAASGQHPTAEYATADHPTTTTTTQNPDGSTTQQRRNPGDHLLFRGIS